MSYKKETELNFLTGTDGRIANVFTKGHEIAAIHADI